MERITHRKMLVVPAYALRDLREGLCGEMAGACEGLLAVMITPERFTLLEWCQPHFDRFDAARGYLEEIGRASQPEDVLLQIGSSNGSVLLAAIRGVLAHPRRAAGEGNCKVDARLRELKAAVEVALATTDAPRAAQGDSSSRAQSRVWPHLTPREEEVLGYLAKGFRYRAIASEMHVTEETIRSHARSLRRKFGVPSSRDLAGISVRAYISSK